MDYVQHTTTLVFDGCEHLVCDFVTILDDCVVEDEESFNLFLASSVDSKVNIDEGHGVVTIIDHDSMYYLYYNGYSSN